MPQPNVDPRNNVHYGVIHRNSILPQCLEDFTDESAKEAEREIVDGLTNALGFFGKRAAEMAKQCMEAINDEFWEHYQNDEPKLSYRKEDYEIEGTDYLIVTKSPFYTMASLCSPCFPNAGDLHTTHDGGYATYCVGDDWFEDNKCPYPIYRISDDAYIGGAPDYESPDMDKEAYE